MDLDAQLTVLLLTYNGNAYLRECLHTLRQYKNVIVIDNGSQESVGIVTRDFKNVRTIRFDRNEGYAGAYNRAISNVSTPYVALLSNDTKLEPGCLEKLVAILDTDHSVGIAAPLLFNLDSSVQDTGWNLDFFGFPIAAEPLGPQWDVFYASGCLMVLKKRLFLDTGGFSKHFDFFVEDVDLCWKARLLGHRVVVAEGARLCHVGGATLSGASTDNTKNQSSLRRSFFRERNVPLAFVQNFGIFQLLFRLPIYALNSLSEAIGIAMLGQPRVSREYLRAWLDFCRLLPQAIAARRKVQRIRRVSDKEITPYFLMRNRKLELILERGAPDMKP